MVEQQREAIKQFLDSKDFQARFFLEPEVDKEGDVDFSHFDKNLAITNLVRNPRYKIDETTKARELLKSLHVINNTKYFYEKKVKKLVGYGKKEEKDGSITRVPIYDEVKVKIPKFPKTFHKLKSSFFSFVNTAASTNGFRVLQAISNRTIREDTINERNEKKGSWFNKPKPKQYY